MNELLFVCVCWREQDLGSYPLWAYRHVLMPVNQSTTLPIEDKGGETKIFFFTIEAVVVVIVVIVHLETWKVKNLEL